MQLVHNIEKTTQAQEREIMKLEKIKESNIPRDEISAPQRQQKPKKATAKRIKTEVLIKKEVKKEKKVSYCTTYLYIYYT
jgi:hypothetical protein